MELHQLETFLAVLEHESFSAAAERLRIGQSTVSFHIKALEASVGARLLERGAGSVRPTAAGKLLRRYAERLLALRDEALSELRAEERAESGEVRIAASTVPAEHLLPPVLARFRVTHPGVRVKVEVSDSRRALDQLLAHGCDLALVGARRPDTRVRYQAIATDEIVLVASPALPGFAHRLDARAFAHAPLILRSEGSGTRASLKALGLTRASRALQVGSNEVARRCALEKLGYAFLSRRVVAEDLERGRLAQVVAPGVPLKRGFYAATLKGVGVSPATAALLAQLAHQR